MTAQPISPPPAADAELEPAQRKPLDPITTHLWRLSHGERRRILQPFVGHWVKLEVWRGRVAALGDKQYRGELVSVAESTVGPTALAVVRTIDGTDWAVSTAQIAYLELAEGGKR